MRKAPSLIILVGRFHRRVLDLISFTDIVLLHTLLWCALGDHIAYICSTGHRRIYGSQVHECCNMHRNGIAELLELGPQLITSEGVAVPEALGVLRYLASMSEAAGSRRSTPWAALEGRHLVNSHISWHRRIHHHICYRLSPCIHPAPQMRARARVAREAGGVPTRKDRC